MALAAVGIHSSASWLARTVKQVLFKQWYRSNTVRIITGNTPCVVASSCSLSFTARVECLKGRVRPSYCFWRSKHPIFVLQELVTTVCSSTSLARASTDDLMSAPINDAGEALLVSTRCSKCLGWLFFSSFREKELQYVRPLVQTVWKRFRKTGMSDVPSWTWFTQILRHHLWCVEKPQGGQLE